MIYKEKNNNFLNQGKKKRFNVFINDTIDIKRTFDSKLN